MWRKDCVTLLVSLAKMTKSGGKELLSQENYLCTKKQKLILFEHVKKRDKREVLWRVSSIKVPSQSTSARPKKTKKEMCGERQVLWIFMKRQHLIKIAREGHQRFHLGENEDTDILWMMIERERILAITTVVIYEIPVA